MSRQNELDRRHRGWRDLALAGVAAATVTLLLVAAVALVWLLGRSPSQAPVLAVQSQSTPTPRSLTFVRNTPTPGRAVPAAVPTATTVVPGRGGSPQVKRTPPRPPSPRPSRRRSARSLKRRRPPAGDDVVFEAPGRNELESLASGSWSASADASSTQAAAPPRSRGSSSPRCRAPTSRSRPRFVSPAASIRSAINRLVSPPAPRAPIRCSAVVSSFHVPRIRREPG